MRPPLQLWLMVFLQMYATAACTPDITNAMKRRRDDAEADELWQSSKKRKTMRTALEALIPGADPVSEDILTLLSYCRLLKS